ncbi:hypothetical protein DBR06_SOUSAS8910017, partial [Sousa chinensis]
IKFSPLVASHPVKTIKGTSMHIYPLVGRYVFTSSLSNLLTQKCNVCSRPISKNDEVPVIRGQHKSQ